MSNIIKTIKTDFVSEIDQFFHEFDRNRPQASLPESRLQEVKKFKIIADKRDNTQAK